VQRLQQLTELEKTFLDLFKRLSVCISIMGRRGTGKTDLSLLIMEILAKHKVMKNFATNIRIYKSSFPIQHITNLQDLEFWCRNTRGRKLFILDEAGKSLRRRTPMSALNVKLLDQLQILRKYMLSLIIVCPHEKYIDSATLGSDVLDAIIVKPQFKNPKVALYHDIMEDIEIWFTEIPRTSVHFNTWDIAPFKLKRETPTPKFKDEDLNILWEWAHGKTAKQLGLNRNQIRRIVHKFIKETLENNRYKLRAMAKEGTVPTLNVTKE